MNDTRQNLAADLAAERARRGMKWLEVARALGMSPQNLTRIRTGEISISPNAARALERFLHWAPGGVAARLAGDQPKPAGPTCPRHEWSAESRRRILDMSEDDILDLGGQIRATSGARAALLWLQEATRIKSEASAIGKISQDTSCAHG